ncbi:MAG: beta strand repeat-containing protein [Anaerolineae bacterium]
MNSLRPDRRTGRLHTATRSLIVSSAIALAMVILLVGALALPTHPSHALAAGPLPPLVLGAVEGSSAAPLLSPPPAPLLQASTSLTVGILSTPFATRDNTVQGGPEVFVVEAVITNTGPTTATTPIVDLDMNPTGGWDLLTGESRQRSLPSMPPGSRQVVYWFAHRSNTIGDPHTYTVTVSAANVNTVTQSLNAFPPFSPTVQTRTALRTGNNGLVSASANVQVGVAFTMSVDYDMGNNPDGVSLQPVGNITFTPDLYRLLSNEVQFQNSAGMTVGLPFRDRLYFSPGSLPAGAEKVRTTYTFVALRPGNATLCPYTDVRFASNNKMDKGFCAVGTTVNITGTLTFSFTKSASSATVQQGQLLTYALRYTNTGSQPISNMYVWDVIPSQTITSSASPTPDTTAGFNTQDRVVWNIGAVAPGAGGQVTLTVLVNGQGADIPDGTPLVNNGFMGIFFNPDDVNPAVTSTVTTTLQAPTIAIGKSDGQTDVIQGQVLTYTLRVTNTGAVTATNLLITDVLPIGVTFGSASPGCAGTSTVTCNLGSLSPNASNTVTITTSVNFNLANGVLLTNSMQAQYSNQGGYAFAVQSESDVDTVLSPILAITKHDFPDPVLSGRNVTYTLLITNTGPAAATNVLITDVLPISMTFVSCGGGSPCGINASNVISWEITSIVSSTTAAVTFSAQVTPALPSGTTIVNQDYGVVSDQTDFLAGAPETTTVLNARAIIRGRAFNDADGNGVLDGGEAGISGVTVTLPGALQPVTATNASGQYTFTLETGGPISVSAEIPAGFFRTSPSPVFLDAALETTETVDFGYAPVTSTFGVVFGAVFDDADASGAQELGENGLSGVSVASTGAVTTPVTTNAFGQYALTFSSPGTYTVTETNPPNYVSTTPDSVAQTVVTGTSSRVDFGDFLGVRIQGQVFDDVNVNAANDSEPGVSGALVAAGADAMITGASGVYTLFVTVQPGQPITVTETDLPGYVSTAANPGPGLIRLDTNTLRLDNPISSTVYAGNDFGDVLATGVVSITGQIFDDMNADGLYNDGGAGLANGRVSASSGMFVTTTASGNFTLHGPPGAVITVTETNPPGYVSTNAIPGNSAVKVNLDTLRVSPLTVGAASANNTFGDVLPTNAAIVTGTLFNDADNDGVFDPGETTFSGEQVSISGTLSQITTTNAAGAYAFAVGAGTFLVNSSVPAGAYRTTPEFLALDTVTGTTYPNQNFGFSNNATAATIYGAVFDDFNGNGLQDLGETGLPGAVIRLFSGATAVATYTTGASGTYAFSASVPGVFRVQETNPPGYFSTSPDQINVLVALGNSYQVNFGDSNRADAGSVHGLVFDDANTNGVQDLTETGIAGVVITTTADNGVDVISATTGSFGQYTFGFDFVSQSSHTIHEIDPPGYRSTTPNVVVVNVLPGSPKVADFGDCQIGVCSSVILGAVFNDANGDGNQGFGELGIPGVTVSLYSGATLLIQATTRPNGDYTFGVVNGVVYRVVETDPPNYHSTTPNEVHVSVVTTGAYIVNFGDSNNPGLSSIFGAAFNDANANSVFDASEVGLPNVPIRIDGNFSGVPITSVTTNYLGQYTFLIDQFTPSNVFTVTETDLPGYVSTTPNVVAQAVAVNIGYTVNFGDLLAPVCAVDAYEAMNDDLFSTTGVTLTTSGSPLHNFFSSNDEDWLRVTLKQGDVYTFTTVAFGARADTVLALFAPDGVTRLAQSDDRPGSTDHSSQIKWVGTTNGAHYLRVTPLTRLPAPGCLTDYSVTMAVTQRHTLVLPLVVRNLP